MKKVTEDYLLEYVSEVGEFSKEFRKYSSFWCTATHTFTQKDIDVLAEDGIDANDFLNIRVTRNGMWSDSDGTDWDDTTYEKVEEHQELVPEVVIPEHYVTRQWVTPFKPVFSE